MKEFTTASDICAHLGDEYDSFHGAIVPPLFQNTLFTSKEHDHGYSYTRVSNPTTNILEKKLAALEKAEAALVFSSGMGAISSVLSSLLRSGDHLIALNSIYPTAASFINTTLTNFGIKCSFVRHASIDELENAVRPETKVLHLESPSSLIFQVQNLKEIAEFCKARGIITVIDNTWATPLYQNPLEFGIDIVIHSATKYIGGHSDVMAGVVMGSKSQIDSLRGKERSLLGTCVDPFAAWLLTRSLRTLEVRMERHSSNAMQVAEYLDKHPKVKKVYYPGLPSHENYALSKLQMRGFSGLMSFVLDITDENAMKFTKNLDVFEVGPSWGGFESLVYPIGSSESGRPAREFQGVPDGLIRISIGLENIDSILSDFENALRKV